MRSALAEYDLAVPPVDRRYADDRLSDLVYYVLRDYVGYGKLTVPVRDPTLEDIEANRVDERVKVVPRADVMAEDLERNPEVIGEAVQTVLRREGRPDAYEQVKALTRGERASLEDFRELFDELDVDESVREELRALTPADYTGLGEELADDDLAAELAAFDDAPAEDRD
jgi:hypothetical protein